MLNVIAILNTIEITYVLGVSTKNGAELCSVCFAESSEGIDPETKARIVTRVCGNEVCRSNLGANHKKMLKVLSI